jgi:hypothetical protein
VKKCVGIILLFFYVISTTEIGQLLKISVMIDHFSEHTKQNEKTTFFQFLAEHYIYDDGNDTDNDTDNKLPFKSPCSGTLLSIAAPTSFFRINYILDSSEKTPTFYEPGEISSFSSVIWQPPKIS